MSMFAPPVTASPDPVADQSAGVDGDRVWRRIADFRGGIHTAVAPGRPPGYAQEAGTYQCYASTAGSLIPTPRVVSRIYRDTSDYTNSEILTRQFRISGVHANAPVYSIDNTNANEIGPDECHTELFVAVEYWTGASTAAYQHLDVSRYLRNTQNPTWESIWDRTYPVGTYSSAVRPRNCVFASQRSNSASVTKSGPQVVGFVFTGNARYFPKDTDTSTSATDSMPGDVVGDNQPGVSPSYLVSHQGRMVIFPVYFTGDGANQLYVSSECAYWTPENDANIIDSDLSGNYFNILGGYEQAAGYGVVASLTANELLLVKVVGGGLFVSGDLNSPTVRTLPYLRSTGLAFCNGAITPVGYIYPADSSGIWLWSGGDTSEHITKHLRPDFWRPSTLTPAYGDARSQAGYGHANTQMTTWNEFTFLPANWMWDTDEMGWWKVLDPDVVEIHRWVSDDRGLLFWGAPSGFRSGADPILWEFSRRYGATHFSWKSHPMEPTIERTTRCDEIAVCGAGLGRVRVSVTTAEAPDDPQTIEVQFTDAAFTQIHRAPINVSGTSLTFQVESFGYDHDESAGSFDQNATQSAPTVHYIDWAAVTSNQIAAG